MTIFTLNREASASSEMSDVSSSTT